MKIHKKKENIKEIKFFNVVIYIYLQFIHQKNLKHKYLKTLMKNNNINI